MKAWADENYTSVIALFFPPAGILLAAIGYLDDRDAGVATRLVVIALLGAVIWGSVLSILSG